MKYSKMLRGLFPEISLIAEDLYFLESFQVKYLPDRVPKKEFSTLLQENPRIQQFLIAKYPPIKYFIETILKEFKSAIDKNTINYDCQELLWEIADLIIYNKHPELYDTKAQLGWDINEIISITSLKDKVIIDAGAGTGRITFMVAQYAKTVYAVEPVSSFRNFIKEKADKEKLINIYAIDGFLDSIPLPDNSADILMTSNAIGWNLEDELIEIERILKPDACAIHLLKALEDNVKNPFHDVLVSSKWNYSYSEFEKKTRLKYFKTIHK